MTGLKSAQAFCGRRRDLQEGTCRTSLAVRVLFDRHQVGGVGEALHVLLEVRRAANSTTKHDVAHRHSEGA